MANVDVSKVWGVGAKTSAKLKKMDINSVLDLKLTNPAKINFYFNVNIERIVVELNRSICFPIITEAPKKNEILSSRSFGRPVSTIEMLSEAITTFLSRATYKARQQEIGRKQIIKERKIVELLEKKSKKMDQQIKEKNQKIKQKQNKIKKEIEKKNEILKIAKVIDQSNNWIGGNTVVVQLGDQIDRCRFSNIPCYIQGATEYDEGNDLKLLKYFTQLHKQAQKHGGAVYSLLGNHEVMNVQQNLRYVSYEGLKEFDNFMSGKRIIKDGKTARLWRFKPGNDISEFTLAFNPACSKLATFENLNPN